MKKGREVKAKKKKLTFLCDMRYLVFHSMLCVYLSFGCGH